MANKDAAVVWKEMIAAMQTHFMLERGLSKHSVSAYTADVRKLAVFCESNFPSVRPDDISDSHLFSFVNYLNDLCLSAATQARILSGLRAFFGYLVLEKHISVNPALALDSPKLRRKIPDVLNYQEIQEMINAIDLSHPLGHRNRAILETLYACGLRVSELTTLKISNIYKEEGFIRVFGKNRRERLVPIGSSALQQIGLYRDNTRKQSDIKTGEEDILFLNRRGKRLTRVMVFYIIKGAAKNAGISKRVSPHTFRHSFATHLVEGGADLKAVQDMLGHASITTTEIYTHLDTDYLRDTLMQYHPRFKQ